MDSIVLKQKKLRSIIKKRSAPPNQKAARNASSEEKKMKKSTSYDSDVVMETDAKTTELANMKADNIKLKEQVSQL